MPGEGAEPRSDAGVGVGVIPAEARNRERYQHRLRERTSCAEGLALPRAPVAPGADRGRGPASQPSHRSPPAGSGSPRPDLASSQKTPPPPLVPVIAPRGGRGGEKPKTKPAAGVTLTLATDYPVVFLLGVFFWGMRAGFTVECKRRGYRGSAARTLEDATLH